MNKGHFLLPLGNTPSEFWRSKTSPTNRIVLSLLIQPQKWYGTYTVIFLINLSSKDKPAEHVTFSLMLIFHIFKTNT